MGEDNMKSTSNSEDQAKTKIDLGGKIDVDISDALSEKDKIKFTIHTKTTLAGFAKNDISVVREHEEFIWLHDVIDETEEYAGYIIPPPPPRPDFEASRVKLTDLSERESSMTKEEFNKMRKELEAEYLATFKKTVAMHEAFLKRLAEHHVMKYDHNLRVFLEYESELGVRNKNSKEKITSIFKRMTQSADEVLLSGQKDVDDFFDYERNYIVELHNHLANCTEKADKMTRYRKSLADSFIRTACNLDKLLAHEKNQNLQKMEIKFIESLENIRKLENKVCADYDLKESDTLRYFMKDTKAAKDLLYRRLRSLANFEAANKNLERARVKNKDVAAAEAQQRIACEKFEKISDVARADLQDFKQRRVVAFKRNLIDLAELQAKHAKNHLALLDQTLEKLKGMS